MGICASSQTTRIGGGGGGGGGRGMRWPATAKVIHVDGRLQEYRQPIRAGHILSQNPKCFLCNSETMYIDSYVPHVPEKEELQLGQIYFLMPLSQSHTPLSISDLCALAIKASTALSKDGMELSSGKASPLPITHGVRLPAGSRGDCKIPVGFNVIGLGSQVDRRNRGIEN